MSDEKTCVMTLEECSLGEGGCLYELRCSACGARQSVPEADMPEWSRSAERCPECGAEMVDGNGVVEVVDDELSCRLERWYSEGMGEWFTGISICESITGRELFHAGMADIELSEDAAVDILQRYRGGVLGTCGAPCATIRSRTAESIGSGSGRNMAKSDESKAKTAK